jgi:hypothetical protein
VFVAAASMGVTVSVAVAAQAGPAGRHAAADDDAPQSSVSISKEASE